MSDKNPYSIDCIFRNLDNWRNLPGFRLEPHVAPFFGLFMADILNCSKKTEYVKQTVIPEFPLRNAEFPASYGFKDKNGSKKVDYLAVAHCSKTAYFVELKTDAHSIEPQQLDYLKAAKEKVNFREFVEAIFELAKASGARKAKYVHLLHRMKELDLIHYSKNVYDDAFENGLKRKRVTRNWKCAIDKVRRKVSQNAKWDAEVVFILPNPCVKKELLKKNSELEDAKFIYFEDVAKVVERKGTVGRVFAKYLRRWADCEAGSPDPRHLIA